MVWVVATDSCEPHYSDPTVVLHNHVVVAAQFDLTELSQLLVGLGLLVTDSDAFFQHFNHLFGRDAVAYGQL